MKTPLQGFFTTTLLLSFFIAGRFSPVAPILWIAFGMVAFVWIIALLFGIAQLAYEE